MMSGNLTDVQEERLPLAYLLLRAGRRFDTALREALTRRGWPALSPAQSLVFAYLPAGGLPPAALARRLGTTRQATQDLLAGLARLDLLEVADDPDRCRGRLVRLTPRGRALAADAATELATLESRVPGAAALRALLSALEPGPRR